MRQNKTFIFTHVPKTAGSSLRIHFQKHLINQSEFIHFANVGFNSAVNNKLLPFSQRTFNSRKTAKVILGHKVDFKTKDLVQGNNIEELVIFRNPLEWEISRYNQHANRLKKNSNLDLDLNQWLTKVNKTHSQFDWFLSNYLKLGGAVRKLNSRVKENLLFYTLSNYHHVLFVDNFEEKIKPIFAELQVPQSISRENAVGKDKINFFQNTESNLHQLEDVCQADINLYEKIRKRF